MGSQQSYEELDEKSIEIILNFKPNEKYDKSAVSELQSLKDKIKKAISLLPDTQKKVSELRYLRNLNKDAICTQLGRNRTEITNILNTAVKSIKKNLKETKPESTKNNVSPPIIAQSTTVSSKWFVIIVVVIFMIIFAATFWTVYLLVTNITKPGALNWFGNVLSDFDSRVQYKESKTVKKAVRPVSVDKLRISGSTSLLSLSKKWESAFIHDYPKYKVSLIQSDSSRGVKALITGNIDIANSSRPITHHDQKKANEYGIDLQESRVALDALVIVVNALNPVSELSLEDLEKIFNSEIQNWQSISNFNKPLILVVRESGSGTNDFVLSRISQSADFPGEPIRRKSNKEIFDLISQSEGAISFINSNNFPWENKKIKYVKIKTYSDSVPVGPFIGRKLNEKAIRYGDYPLAHYLYLITTVDCPEGVSDFIGWVLSGKGQKIVKDSGLLPVKTNDE